MLQNIRRGTAVRGLLMHLAAVVSLAFIVPATSSQAQATGLVRVRMVKVVCSSVAAWATECRLGVAAAVPSACPA